MSDPRLARFYRSAGPGPDVMNDSFMTSGAVNESFTPRTGHARFRPSRPGPGAGSPAEVTTDA